MADNPLATVAADTIRRWKQHPAAMVEELFGAKPDPAQYEGLEAFPHSPRLALQACTGSGKTTLLSWCSWNFLLTRLHPMIGAASINSANLKTNLWTEMARWRGKAPLLQHVFEQTDDRIFARQHRETWKMEARTWARDANEEQIGNAFRGLHADNVMWVLDETGEFPKSVIAICEAIFSGSPTEAHMLISGNPTSLSGALYFACVTAKKHWRVISITADPDDPQRTPRVSIEHAREQIELWGRDSPWVAANILGQFPAQAFNALVGPADVRAAMARHYRDHDIGHAAKVGGGDVADGGDDASVLCTRHGIQVTNFDAFRYADIRDTAGQFNRLWGQYDLDAMFVDRADFGLVSHLRNYGKNPIIVPFAGIPRDATRFVNKRAEMYWDACQWIKEGGALPPNTPTELLRGLCETLYFLRKDKVILEPKESVKAKLGFSPDHADSFVLSFSDAVSPKARNAGGRHGANHQVNYDPFAQMVADSYHPT